MKLAEFDIGAKGQDVYPEKFSRPFKPLSQEVQRLIGLSGFRLGDHPRLASIKLTDKCPFRCAHCNAWQYEGEDMITDEICNVQDNLKQVGIQRLDYTGGEPLRRKDLLQIISHGADLGMLVTVNTSGGVKRDTLADEYADWYERAEAGLFGAYFSYDATDQKNDPRVIHLAGFLVNTLHIFGGIRTVVTKDNLDKVYAIGRRCMLNNIFYQPVPAVALNGKSSGSADNFHTLDHEDRKKFIEIVHELSKVRGPLFDFLHIKDAFLNEVVNSEDPDSAWHCKRPSAHWIFVDAQGNPRVCNDRTLPEAERFSLKGKENPLLSKEFHNAVSQETKKCGGCSWFCNWESNRRQTIRGATDLRFYLTINSLT